MGFFAFINALFENFFKILISIQVLDNLETLFFFSPLSVLHIVIFYGDIELPAIIILCIAFAVLSTL